ncbi:MAG: DUF1847 domain-containing protein [Desulfuromonadales bacterium]|nr:DUF1847 domain-containing protein [Desulfuromonadales bacterium]
MPKIPTSVPLPTCAICSVAVPDRFCRQVQGKAPGNCPSTRSLDIIKEALEILKNPTVMEFARQASIQEGEAYGERDKGYANLRPIKPRIQETVEFAKKMKFQRICLVFCVGMRKEAEVIHEIFTVNGFETISVMCKAGAISKEEIGLLREQQIDPTSFEAMCNPILQALTSNHHGSELNVLFGLCVGHDALFLKYAEAYSTVLASKDRLLAHNPLAAIYQYESYYRYLKSPLVE